MIEIKYKINENMSFNLPGELDQVYGKGNYILNM